jgi:hypothetical protein
METLGRLKEPTSYANISQSVSRRLSTVHCAWGESMQALLLGW